MKSLLLFVILFTGAARAESYCWAVCYYRPSGSASFSSRQVTTMMATKEAAWEQMVAICDDAGGEPHLLKVETGVPANVENVCNYTKEQLDKIFNP